MPARVIKAGEGRLGWLGGIGVRFLIPGADAHGSFALVEHPLEARALGAPLHRHSREDEYSFVLSGRVGALLGDEVVYGEPGDLIFKPRGQWHTFWNAGDAPCEIIEVISPAGFENYWRELRTVWPDRTKSAAFLQKYELDVDFDSVPKLCARFGLKSASVSPR